MVAPGTPRGALAGQGDADLSHRQQAAKNLPWKATGGHIARLAPFRWQVLTSRKGACLP